VGVPHGRRVLDVVLLDLQALPALRLVLPQREETRMNFEKHPNLGGALLSAAAAFVAAVLANVLIRLLHTGSIW
jgi:hypothetical protein